EWIIESLSDSTIYMSFYTISHLLKKHNISPDQLSPEFFDFVFLEEGQLSNVSNKTNIESELLKQMQDEFIYWYPVDHRHTAIMHISNHLSFYIFHHVAIFPEKHWPKIVSLIEPIIIEGQKMGKSKGNVIQLGSIQSNYSADLFRFYISHSADFGINMDWREKQIQIVKNHINRFYTFVVENIEKIRDIDAKIENIQSKYSKVILSKCLRILIEAGKGLEELNQRKYLQLSFYEVFNLLQDYTRYCEDSNDIKIIFKIIFPDWIQILSLTMPHLCEELWQLMGNQEFISKTIWGDFHRDLISDNLEEEYDYIATIVDDISNIRKIVKSKDSNEIYLYTAPKWKNDILDIVISKKGNFNEILVECKKDKELMKNKDLISYIKNQIKNRIWEKGRLDFDENKILKDYKNHIEKRINNPIIINSEFDPNDRAQKAMPYKPAIYIKT
ncbi:MAG: class I tRNA ligase family protein, partial [Candidatus Hodarchaeota archaeon]